MERPTKEHIRQLPLFRGIELASIVVIKNKQEAQKAINELKNHKTLGFDTESKPCFQKGEISTGPHLIQLATASKAFLFPTRFPAAVEQLDAILSDPHITKVGFGLAGDEKGLRTKLGIQLVNSKNLATKLGSFFGFERPVGLKVAVAMMLKLRLTKRAQLSNWAIFPLREDQLRYAANDAYASLCIEFALQEALQSGEVREVIALGQELQ